MIKTAQELNSGDQVTEAKFSALIGKVDRVTRFRNKAGELFVLVVVNPPDSAKEKVGFLSHDDKVGVA